MQHKLTIIGEVAKEIFKVSFVFFLIFFTIDQFNPGYISNFLNLSYPLIFSLICGIIGLICPSTPRQARCSGQNNKKETWRNYIFPVFMVILAFLLFWNLTNSMGVWSWLFGFVAALVVGLVWRNLEDRETEKLKN